MTEKEYKCLNCDEELFDNDKYYFCKKCNPLCKTDAIKGCFYKCQTCSRVIVMDVGHDYWCDNCEDVICQSCVIIPDEDEDSTYCKNCIGKGDGDD